MKNTLTTSLAVLLTAAVTTLAQTPIKPPKDIPTETTDLKKAKQSLSYGLGFQNGEQFASYGFIASDIDKVAYIKGLIDALNKKDFANPEDYDKAMKAFDKIIFKRETQLAKINLDKEIAFFKKNAKRPEITTTPSGLQYEILKKGTGKTYAPPQGTLNGMDNITEFIINCRGTLLDGSEFMSTPKGQPLAFNLQVIHGFAEALKIMPIGSKWKIYVPSKLAFGQQRQGAKIAPNSTLIYTIELIDIKRRQPTPPQR